MCDNLGRTVAEYPHSTSSNCTERRLEIEGKEIADAKSLAEKA
jgi:hypothetical protein